MADVIYDRFLTGIYGAEYDMDNPAGTNVYVVLVSGTYTPDQASHDTYADVTAHECDYGNPTNYSKGGLALTGTVSAAGVAPARTGVWDAQDVTWANSTITNASGAVIFHSGGAADTSKLLVAFVDFVTLKSSSAGDFTITWNADGILGLRQG
jgi:hypothetical protein